MPPRERGHLVPLASRRVVLDSCAHTARRRCNVARVLLQYDCTKHVGARPPDARAKSSQELNSLSRQNPCIWKLIHTRHRCWLYGVLANKGGQSQLPDV
eukprot:6214726-Pleurochrysis_carterae.AAC.4